MTAKGSKNLAVVIVFLLLISILVLVGVPTVLDAYASSKLSQAYRDMRDIHQALESYFTDYDDYPPDFDSGQIKGVKVYDHFSEYRSYACLTSPIGYLKTVPMDVYLNSVFAERLKTKPYYEYAGPGTHLIKQWEPTKTKWTLISIGPDLKNQKTFELDYLQAQKTAYHSSNGLRSWGDIYASNHGVINPLR